MSVRVRPCFIPLGAGLALALIVAGGLSACGRATPPPAPPPATQPAPASQPAEADRLLGRVRVVDLQGQPLEGMLPIATTSPNAFDAPISQGGPTTADGEGALWLPPGAHVFVRAWDPALGQFANNFYEILPSESGETDLMTVQMVEGCAVSLLVADASGQPLEGAEVTLMLLHPTQGPWWPAKGVADALGALRFERVPPGQFGFRLETAAGSVDLPAALLPPGGAVDLGAVQLQ